MTSTNYFVVNTVVTLPNFILFIRTISLNETELKPTYEHRSFKRKYKSLTRSLIVKVCQTFRPKRHIKQKQQENNIPMSAVLMPMTPLCVCRGRGFTSRHGVLFCLIAAAWMPSPNPYR